MNPCGQCGEPVALPAFVFYDVPKSEENPVGRACGRCPHPIHALAQEVVDAAVAAEGWVRMGHSANNKGRLGAASALWAAVTRLRDATKETT